MGYNRRYHGNEFHMDVGISIHRNRYMGIYEVEE